MRRQFGQSPADWTFTVGDGNTAVLAGGVVLTMWDNPTSGTQLTDLLSSAGSPITTVTTSTGTDGLPIGTIPLFYGPSGATQLWVDAGGGYRSQITGHDAYAPSDDIRFGQIAGATVSGTPAAGRILVATGSSATAWTDAATLGWANVRTGYGATGDGTTDDTTAVQAAVNSGKPVYFPAGTYLCSTITLPAGAVLTGANPGGFTTPVPAGQLSTLKLKNGTNGHLLTGGTGASWVRIQGLHLDGNKASNTSGNLVHVADTGSSEQGDWVLTDCYLENAAGVGIYGGVNRLQVQALRCSVYGSASHGVQFMAADATLQNCSIGLSGGSGVLLGASAWVAHLNACDIWSSTLSGIDSTAGAAMVQIAGCGIDRHQRNGLVVGGGSVSVVGCLFHSNSQAANATYPHIAVTAGAISVTGTVFGTDGLANNPDYAIKPSGGTVYEWANRTESGATVTGYCSDPTKVTNLVTGSVQIDVASQLNVGGSGSGAKITVKPTNQTDQVFATRNGSETVSRYTIDGLGTHQWSSGAASADISVSRTAANQLSLALADFRISTAGKGLAVAEGSNAKMGTAILASGTVTVSTTAVTANSRIFLTNQALGGTAGFLRVSARTAGTSFAITSSSGTDTSTVAWMLIEPA